MSRKFVLSGATRGEVVFARQQSLATKAAEWESRIRPMASWAQIGIWVAEAIGLLWMMAAFVFLATAG